MSECLYQLYAVPELRPGDWVFVNGPHDRFGRIVKSIQTDRVEGRDYELYLIRGAPVPLRDREGIGARSFDTYAFNLPLDKLNTGHTFATMKETNSYRK